MASVAGVDATKKGWVAVIADESGFREALVVQSIADLTPELGDLAVIAIDIPIGLPSKGKRKADIAARKFVGPRRSSVFTTPPRAVIEAPTYAEARDIATRRFGYGVSAQAYALAPKILEVDAVAQVDDRIIEAHPEVSFRALAGRDLRHSKRTWNGQMERRRLLAGSGITLPDRFSEAGDVPVDDVLDAAVCAWTAARYASGEAGRLPEPDDIGDDRRLGMIRY